MSWLQLILATIICTCAGDHADMLIREQPWVISENLQGFELYSEQAVDAKEIWRQVLSVRSELAETVGVKPADKPIRILIFSSQKRYLEALLPLQPQGLQRKALFVSDGKASTIFLTDSRSLVTDLRHEIVHAIVHQHLPFLPLWMDEGFSEYFEEPFSSRGNARRSQSVRWRARLRQHPTLASLEKIPSAHEMDADDYRDSWAWVSFLLNESPETHALLTEYLRRIHEGESPPRFEEYAKAELGELNERAASYFRTLPVRLESPFQVAPVNAP